MTKRVVLAVLFAMAYMLFTAALPSFAGEAPPPPDKNERCPVCGMFVAPFPSWLAVLSFESGKLEYFDGPKDMFRRMGKLDEEATPYVTDYYSTEMIPARTAWFVVGSDTLGPMGNELVPLSSKKEALEFRRDHGGERPYNFKEITPELIGMLR